MNRFCVPLATITDDGTAIDAEVPASELRPDDAPGIEVGSVRVQGLLSEAGGEYVFLGVVSGAYVHACDRCLEEARAPFRAEVTWIFATAPAADAADEEPDEEGEDDVSTTFAFEGNEIDLAPPEWEEVVLAAPAKYLCTEDCAGLCPCCGANLNRGKCACRQEQTLKNMSFAGLADLFPEFRAEPSED